MTRDLLHFDIETVGEYENFEQFEENDKRGSDLFYSKYIKLKWYDKYDSVDAAYIDNAGIISTYGKIVCISFGFTSNNGEKKIKSIIDGDEKSIVKYFNEVLKKAETKNINLSGFRIRHFDIPWLLHKLHKYDIEPSNIIYTYDKKPWEMRITDLSEDWKGSFAWFYSFDEVCYELNVKSPKVKTNGSLVHSIYWNEGDINRIKEYCEQDISSSIDVENKIYKNKNKEYE